MFRRLWARLLSLFKVTPAGDRGDLFDPEETLIYTHLIAVKEGGEKVFARKDPLKLWQRVMEHAAALDADLKVARSPSKAAAERYQAAVARVREIFEIPPFAEGGLPDPLALRLFGHFMAYSDTLKKNTPAAMTSAAATLPATPSTSSAEDSPTPTTPASGSTATAPSTGSPTPSASAAA